MDWGDTARMEGAWAGDPDIIALCPAAACPVVGDRVAIGRDADGRYVASWSGGVVELYVGFDRDRDEHVTHEGVEGIVHRVRPVRPEPRREAYILSLHVDPASNPPARRVKREPDQDFERPEPDPARNDF